MGILLDKFVYIIHTVIHVIHIYNSHKMKINISVKINKRYARAFILICLRDKIESVKKDVKRWVRKYHRVCLWRQIIKC